VSLVRPQNLWNGEVVPILSLFPQKIRRKLNYNCDFAFTPNSATSGFVFSANSLYDPEVSSTGHQPMGFDQIMIFYQYYTVIRSTIKVILRQYVAGDGNYMMGAGLKVTTSSSFGSSWTQEVESGNMEYTYLNAPPVNGSGAAGAVGQLQASCSIGKYLDIPKPLDYADLKGTSSSSPVKQVYFQVLGYSPDTVTGDAVEGNAFIQYDAEFTSPILPTLSSAEFLQRTQAISAEFATRQAFVARSRVNERKISSLKKR